MKKFDCEKEFSSSPGSVTLYQTNSSQKKNGFESQTLKFEFCSLCQLCDLVEVPKLFWALVSLLEIMILWEELCENYMEWMCKVFVSHLAHSKYPAHGRQCDGVNSTAVPVVIFLPYWLVHPSITNFSLPLTYQISTFTEILPCLRLRTESVGHCHLNSLFTSDPFINHAYVCFRPSSTVGYTEASGLSPLHPNTIKTSKLDAHQWVSYNCYAKFCLKFSFNFPLDPSLY